MNSVRIRFKSFICPTFGLVALNAEMHLTADELHHFFNFLFVCECHAFSFQRLDALFTGYDSLVCISQCLTKVFQINQGVTDIQTQLGNNGDWAFFLLLLQSFDMLHTLLQED